MSHQDEQKERPAGAPDAPQTKWNPILIVIMGVAGTGKTTLALSLQSRLGMPYIEGDALHPPDNIAKMSVGVPLTDADREPWLERIRTTAERTALEHPDAAGALATCSALRGYYRDILRGTRAPPGLPIDVDLNGNGVRDRSLPAYFVYIKGGRDVIWERISAREGHYMKPGMLDSQFAALESPEGEEGVVVVPLEGSTEEQTDIAIRELNKLLPEPLSVGPPSEA
ncbi:carbohydrate kinase [Ganoderma leucocontextum]|nr:carbohydrate kinase [Ganoderma leucocontextum]